MRFLFILALGLAVATSCRDASNIDTLKVGAILSLTGPAAPYGQDNRTGMQLAVDSINRAGGVGGKKLILDIRDDAGDATQAVTLARAFASDPNVVAILGPTRTGATVAASKILASSPIPMISVGATGDWASAAGEFSPWLYRTTRVDTYLIDPLLRFARDSLNVRRVALIYTSDDDWSRSLLSAYVRTAIDLGMQVVDTVSQKTGDLDRSAQLARVQAKHPDALIVNTLSTDAPTIATQARRQGYRGRFLGTAGFSNPQTWKLADPGALDGTVLAENYYAESDRSAVRAFVKLYRDKSESAPPPYAAYAWDGVMLLQDACRRAKPCTNRDSLRVALSSTTDLELVLGKVSYHGSGDAAKPPVILEIQKESYLLRDAPHAP